MQIEPNQYSPKGIYRNRKLSHCTGSVLMGGVVVCIVFFLIGFVSWTFTTLFNFLTI